MSTGIRIRAALSLSLLCAIGVVHAKVSPEEAAKLGKSLMPLGGEMAGNQDGTIPAWDGGYNMAEQPAEPRHLESYPPFDSDKPQFTITAANMAKYADKLSVGQKAMLKKFPNSYKLPVYVTRRSANAPDYVYEATRANAVKADLANGGESLVDAITGIPFPMPGSGKEVIWNHKVRYRGLGVRRYNTQLAVQPSGDFTPYKLREDVRFHYSYPNVTPASLENVIIYFLQFTLGPPRQAGTVLLVHETMDQVKEPRRAWQYNPGLRRLRRAPDVGYDNPGTGADGLRTNDQLDTFNGATDRYTWKIVGKKEMYMPYNAIQLADNRLKYRDLARPGHIDQDQTRYELHRVWVVEAEVRPEVTHLYARRTFYVDEDSWTILAVDIYDRRGQLWRVQEQHMLMIPWQKSIGVSAEIVYDLFANRYLAYGLSNEEPLYDYREFDLSHFTTNNVVRMATR